MQQISSMDKDNGTWPKCAVEEAEYVGLCRDMCDNMERFFYQAWKEASLPLPPGAGPTLSRTRPKASTGPAWQDEQQGQRGNKRKRHDAQYEVCVFLSSLSCSFVHPCSLSPPCRLLRACPSSLPAFLITLWHLAHSQLSFSTAKMVQIML